MKPCLALLCMSTLRWPRIGGVFIDDSACEDLNENRETAEGGLRGLLKVYSYQYLNREVNIVEDEEYYHIDFRIGLGEGHYKKSEWTLDKAIEDQANI